jgi:hypothetical protein
MLTTSNLPPPGAQFTCVTSTKVQILTQKLCPGWDDGASFVSGPQNGPNGPNGFNGSGVYVLPLTLLPLAGPYDFDVTLAPNASLAGEEVRFLQFFGFC